jgi:hypothetical protein
LTTYPAIIPSSRNFTPGQYPHTPFQALSGKQGQVRHSSVMISSTVQLRYSVLDEPEMIEILDHYNAVKGGLIPFALPAIVWSGNENANEFTLPGDAWRYASPPEVEEVFCGDYVVQVELESVPGEGVGLLGADFIIGVTLLPGVAAAASGKTFIIGVSLEIGVGRAPGATETIDVTLTPGTATGGIAVIGPPVVAEVRVSLISGLAFAGLSRVFTINTSLFVDPPIKSQITYSQSTVWTDSAPASNAIMTDGSFSNSGAATFNANPAWVKMDLGNIYDVFEIVVGTATNAIPGGWNKSWTENKNIQYSTDDANWTTAFSTGTFPANGIYTFGANFTARYIRIATTSNDYVAISEFYARVLGGTANATGGANAPGATKTVTVTLTPGAASSP